MVQITHGQTDMAGKAEVVVLVILSIIVALLVVVVVYAIHKRMQCVVIYGFKKTLPVTLPDPVGRLLPVEVLPKLSKPLPSGYSVLITIEQWSGLTVQLQTADAGKLVARASVPRLNANGVPFSGQLDYALTAPTASAMGSYTVNARPFVPVSVVLKESGPFVIQVDVDKAFVPGSQLTAPTVDQKQLIDNYMPYEMRYTIRVIPDSQIANL